jgi:hypothetical protein
MRFVQLHENKTQSRKPLCQFQGNLDLIFTVYLQLQIELGIFQEVEGH